MQDSTYPDLNFDFAFKLTNESDRGAVLIGASKIEEYLTKLILSILPKEQKSYTSKLINYPGPISSFSGKIELLFAFRIIDERLYNSLNYLRTIRNKAAHSSEHFSLKDFTELLPKISDFEETFTEVTNAIALDNLLKWKKIKIKKVLDETNLDSETYKKLWNESVSNLEHEDSTQEHLLIWKLSYGLTFMCLKISAIHDEYSNFNRTAPWIEYIKME